MFYFIPTLRRSASDGDDSGATDYHCIVRSVKQKLKNRTTTTELYSTTTAAAAAQRPSTRRTEAKQYCKY